MAVTAILSVVEAALSSGQEATFVVDFTNGGGSDVEVTNFSAWAPNAAPCYLDPAEFQPRSNRTIAASGGTLRCSFQGVFYANLRQDTDVTEDSTYAVQFQATLDDDSVVTTNAVTMTITPPAEPTLAMPQIGQLDFRTNNNSDLLAVI
jgi:hypothetical protein